MEAGDLTNLERSPGAAGPEAKIAERKRRTKNGHCAGKSQGDLILGQAPARATVGGGPGEEPTRGATGGRLHIFIPNLFLSLDEDP